MMTETISPAEPQAADSPRIPRPHTDAAALRTIEEATAHVRERALRIRENPEEHKPKLVLSQHVRGTSILDRIADAVNKFCGSMYVFIGITVGIVAWLFLGNVVGFDKTPWPLLLTILNLPQLSIMISLQVSANRAQAASDRRGIADHETLIALHEMAKQQLDILNGQDRAVRRADPVRHLDGGGLPVREQRGRAGGDCAVRRVVRRHVDRLRRDLRVDPARPPRVPAGPTRTALGGAGAVRQRRARLRGRHDHRAVQCHRRVRDHRPGRRVLRLRAHPTPRW
jgi:uncharacterized membrane protein